MACAGQLIWLYLLGGPTDAAATARAAGEPPHVPLNALPAFSAFLHASRASSAVSPPSGTRLQGTRRRLSAYMIPSPPAPSAPPPTNPGWGAVAGGYFIFVGDSVGCLTSAMLANAGECEAAATALSLSDTTATTTSSSYGPPGCYFSYGSLYFSYPESYSYDSATGSTTHCGPDSNECVCKVPPPDPPASPSVPPPPMHPPGAAYVWLGTPDGTSGCPTSAMVTSPEGCLEAFIQLMGACTRP